MSERIDRLRCTPFERYMLVDDRTSHPMSFTIRTCFTGQVDEAAWRSAVRQALARHPLLTARIEFDERNRPLWRLGGEPECWLSFLAAGEAFRFPGSERIDLAQNSGVRIWVRRAAGQSEVRWQFHHACCDGVGAYDFIADVLYFYDVALRPAATDRGLPERDPNLLPRRNRFGLPWWRVVLRLLVEAWGVVAGLLTFLVPRPQPLRTPQTPDPAQDDGLTLLDYPAHTFTEEESQRLRQAARTAGVTFNDLLLRDLFLATHAWNVEHDPPARRDCVRIMIPMNLRGPRDAALPAANVVGMVFLDRRGLWQRPRFLLRTIRWETAFLKFFRFGVSFNRCCAVLGEIPGGLAWLTRPIRCRGTTVLSNLGLLFHQVQLPRDAGRLAPGNLILERAESAPPVRAFCHTSLSTFSYAGRLTACLNYDRRHLTAVAAPALLSRIVRQLLDSAAEAATDS